LADRFTEALRGAEATAADDPSGRATSEDAGA
jgi:hypothetical protein